MIFDIDIHLSKTDTKRNTALIVHFITCVVHKIITKQVT